MKNVLITKTDGTFSLLNTVDDGTNALVVNDSVIPTTDWVGSGAYTFTVGSVTYTIRKAPDLDGNYHLIQGTETTYHFEKALSNADRITQQIEEAVSTKVDMTDALMNLDTGAAAGTTDGDLYSAIEALGWESDVIV